MERKKFKSDLLFNNNSTKEVDFTFIPANEEVLKCRLLMIEDELSRDDLTHDEYEDNVGAHIRIWNMLPAKYKSELSDLSAMAE